LKPATTEDILALMNGSVYAAVVGAAMEWGIFWRLAEQPLSAPALAHSLDIPLNRCQYWLQLLCQLGLLEALDAGYAPSAIARETILNVQDQATWAFQAREDRDLALYVRDLALNIGRPMSTWPPPSLPPVEPDPGYTARFTRKLYQIHRSFAGQLANLLDLRGVTRLLDLGGGSGVVSLALLRKQEALTALVVDVESVCQVGKAIASENKLAPRITYLAADFLTDDLPAGFDLALLCDVGVFSATLFRKIHALLNPEGRLVIVDKFAPSSTGAPPSRLLAAFLASLEAPAPSLDYITAPVVQALLEQAGFRDVSTTPVPHDDQLPWNIDWTLLEAHKEKVYKG